MTTLSVAYGKCNCCLPISYSCKFLSTEEEEVIVISKSLPLASDLKASWTWDFRFATALEAQLEFYWLISYKYVWYCRWPRTLSNLCNVGRRSLSPITVMVAPTIHALDPIDREDIWSCNVRGCITNSLVIQEDGINSLANFHKTKPKQWIKIKQPRKSKGIPSIYADFSHAWIISNIFHIIFLVTMEVKTDVLYFLFA